jgi:hypothetical protein
MKPAALGFRVHSGWTALVAVALEDRFPIPLLRERSHLVKTFTYEFRQPYHTAEKKHSTKTATSLAGRAPRPAPLCLAKIPTHSESCE